MDVAHTTLPSLGLHPEHGADLVGCFDRFDRTHRSPRRQRNAKGQPHSARPTYGDKPVQHVLAHEDTVHSVYKAQAQAFFQDMRADFMRELVSLQKHSQKIMAKAEASELSPMAPASPPMPPPPPAPRGRASPVPDASVKEIVHGELRNVCADEVNKAVQALVPSMCDNMVKASLADLRAEVEELRERVDAQKAASAPGPQGGADAKSVLLERVKAALVERTGPAAGRPGDLDAKLAELGARIEAVEASAAASTRAAEQFAMCFDEVPEKVPDMLPLEARQLPTLPPRNLETALSTRLDSFNLRLDTVNSRCSNLDEQVGAVAIRCAGLEGRCGELREFVSDEAHARVREAHSLEKRVSAELCKLSPRLEAVEAAVDVSSRAASDFAAEMDAICKETMKIDPDLLLGMGGAIWKDTTSTRDPPNADVRTCLVDGLCETPLREGSQAEGTKVRAESERADRGAVGGTAADVADLASAIARTRAAHDDLQEDKGPAAGAGEAPASRT